MCPERRLLLLLRLTDTNKPKWFSTKLGRGLVSAHIV